MAGQGMEQNQPVGAPQHGAARSISCHSGKWCYPQFPGSGCNRYFVVRVYVRTVRTLWVRSPETAFNSRIVDNFPKSVDKRRGMWTTRCTYRGGRHRTWWASRFVLGMDCGEQLGSFHCYPHGAFTVDNSSTAHPRPAGNDRNGIGTYPRYPHHYDNDGLISIIL